ncbi:MAG: LamG domain-containing protein, partial [Verrucomicrobia subdivision 3 bacterium]|nr:LamG domain-containing protein [Limisphaerales bacterium]
LHNGLHLQPTAGVIPTNIYTIVMLFRLDQTNGYRRLIDFKAGANNGLYSYNGRLYFYPSALAPASTIAASNYVQVVLTRDGTNVVGYVNGTPQFSFTDSAEYGVLTSANDLRFFKDDGTTEESGGAVARIRLYAAAMPAGQVALLDRTDCAGVPHFLTPWFDALNVLNLPVEHVIPGIAYRLQASTNLSTWTSIVTNTPIADPTLFTDPKATNYPNRMYRLVTP